MSAIPASFSILGVGVPSPLGFLFAIIVGDDDCVFTGSSSNGHEFLGKWFQLLDLGFGVLVVLAVRVVHIHVAGIGVRFVDDYDA